MPAESKAQARWAFANQNAPGKLGKAAREFVPTGPGAIKKLPERVARRTISQPQSQIKDMQSVLNSVKS